MRCWYVTMQPLRYRASGCDLRSSCHSVRTENTHQQYQRAVGNCVAAHARSTAWQTAQHIKNGMRGAEQPTQATMVVATVPNLCGYRPNIITEWENSMGHAGEHSNSKATTANTMLTIKRCCCDQAAHSLSLLGNTQRY